MKGHTKTGQTLWDRSEREHFYYWINGKQGHPSGCMWVRNKATCRSKLLERHPGCTVNAILSDPEYRCY